MKYESIVNDLKIQLNEHRFIHTLGVANTCEKLAFKYGENTEDAYLSGLLHDCARRYNPDELLDFSIKHGIEVSDVEKSAPLLLHAKVGVYLAKNEYNITSSQVLDAIKCHVTGKPNMNLLEKILYISDYIEPNRINLPKLDEVRAMAYEDIDQTLLTLLELSINHLKNDPSNVMDPMTLKTYNYYKGLE